MIGAKEFASALKLVSSADKKAVAKGIAVAAGIEQESFDFYSKQENDFSDAELKQFFHFLALQEKGHLLAINALKAELEQNKKIVEAKLEDSEHPNFFAKENWDKGEQEKSLTAMLFALWKEKQAQEFYSGIAQSVQSQEVKKFFLALVSFEKKHEEMLSAFVESSYYTRELIMG